MAPRIALLNAAYTDDETRRNFGRVLPGDVVEFDVTAGDRPDSFDLDAAVVTGSRASAYWDEPWIRGLRGWLRGADAAGVPLLGVCFGHQALAGALGGTVEDMGEYELGYREVRRTGDSPLFAGFDRRFTAFASHHDTVAELPSGADRLAANEYGVQAFRRGTAFGVQFHPEVDLESARRIAADKEEFLDPDRFESLVAGLTEERHAAARPARRVFENFGRIAARRAASAGD